MDTGSQIGGVRVVVVVGGSHGDKRRSRFFFFFFRKGVQKEVGKWHRSDTVACFSSLDRR